MLLRYQDKTELFLLSGKVYERSHFLVDSGVVAASHELRGKGNLADFVVPNALSDAGGELYYMMPRVPNQWYGWHGDATVSVYHHVPASDNVAQQHG